jgi:molybdenum cofactor synthesis domain-containing protein
MSNPASPPAPVRVGLLTASDRSASGERRDETAHLLNAVLPPGWVLGDTEIAPDEADRLAAALTRLIPGHDLVITCGGTGLTARDVTPEATRRVITREVPGIAEWIRRVSVETHAGAMLSRGIAGVAGDPALGQGCLIVNFPGNPRAFGELLPGLAGAIGHAVKLLRKAITDCADDKSVS